MPGDNIPAFDTTWWGPNLTAYVDNGPIPESRLTDMAERIIAGWYFLDQDDNYPAGASWLRIGFWHRLLIRLFSQLQRVQHS